jgi:DNA-binding transcriptional MerR regulator
MSAKTGEEKRYYSISEVARMTSLEPYVLRYWEKEFSMLRPKKNRGGTRLYTSRDIELINRIKHLRTKEKLTIAGARKKLTMKGRSEASAEMVTKARAKTLLAQIRKEVEEILAFFA